MTVIKDGIGTFLIHEDSIPRQGNENIIDILNYFLINKPLDSVTELSFRGFTVILRKLSNSIYNFLLKDEGGNILHDMKGICIFDISVFLKMSLNLNESDIEIMKTEMIDLSLNISSDEIENIILDINNAINEPILELTQNDLSIIKEEITDNIKCFIDCIFSQVMDRLDVLEETHHNQKTININVG
jgi:hypothetical protein